MTHAGNLVGTAEYYEVVWPLDRRDYLTVETHPLVSPEPAAPAITAITVASQAAGDGRRLPAKALLLGAHCRRKRIVELLRISRWTLDRIAQRKTVAESPDPKVFEMAHACLEESSTRGSTAEEREAARAWLQTPTLAPTNTADPSTSEVPPVGAVPVPEPLISQEHSEIASAHPSPSPSSRGRPRLTPAPPAAVRKPTAGTIMNG